MIYELHGNRQSIAWLPGDHGMIVKGRSWLFDNGFFIFDKENTESRNLDRQIKPGINYRVSQAASKPYIYFKKDHSKSQLNILYKYDYMSGDRIEIFSIKAEIPDFLISPDGEIIIFSTKLNDKEYQLRLLKTNNDNKSNTEVFYCTNFHPQLIAVNPEGPEIIFSEKKRDEKNILLYDYQEKSSRILFKYRDDSVYQKSYNWSKDGRFLYYLSNKASDFIELHRLDLNLFEDSVLTSQIYFDVEDFAIFSEDQILISINNNGFSSLKYYNNIFNAFQEIEGLPWGQYEIIKHPSKYLISVNVSQAYNQKHTFLLSLNKSTNSSWKVGRINLTENELIYRKPFLINYPVYDSLKGTFESRAAYLYKNTDVVMPLPVLIHLHGGPREQARPYYGLNSNILNQGIAIIELNFSGSTGYGKTFEIQDNGKNRINALKDIGALLDWVAQNPGLDENRVAVAGGSYGGFLALASMAYFSDKITCGLNYYGITDFQQLYKEADTLILNKLRKEYGDERKTEVNLFLRTLSPINNVDNLVMPLLIYHGSKDPVVSVNHSRDLVNVLSLKNQNLWYVEASNEGHGLRDPMNYLYVQGASFLFLERYLIGSEQ